MKISQLIDILKTFEDKDIYLMGIEMEYVNICKDYIVLDVDPIEDNDEFTCIPIEKLKK